MGRVELLLNQSNQINVAHSFVQVHRDSDVLVNREEQMDPLQIKPNEECTAFDSREPKSTYLVTHFSDEREDSVRVQSQ